MNTRSLYAAKAQGEMAAAAEKQDQAKDILQHALVHKQGGYDAQAGALYSQAQGLFDEAQQLEGGAAVSQGVAQKIGDTIPAYLDYANVAAARANGIFLK